MSSTLIELRDKGIEKAKELVQDPEKAGKVFDLTLNAARSKLPSEKEDGEISPLYMLGSQALNKVEAHRAELMYLGQDGLVAFLGYLAAGDESGAKSIYRHLEKSAGWDELYAASASLQKKTIEDRVERDKFYAAMWDLGASAARAALPFLLAAAKVVIPV
jgi:hypothetical protein